MPLFLICLGFNIYTNPKDLDWQGGLFIPLISRFGSQMGIQGG